MKSFLLLLKESPSEDEFFRFVESLGGQVHRAESGERSGTIGRGEPAIYVDYFPEAGLLDMGNAERALGCMPRICLSIHIGHAKGSEELSEEFTISVLNKWSGIRWES